MKKSLKKSFLIIYIIIGGLFTKNVICQTTAYDYYLASIEKVNAANYTEALTLINKSVEKDATNSDYAAYKGYVLRNTGNYENSLVCMQKAIELNSKVGWYYVEAIVSAHKLQYLELTKEYCNTALTFGKDNLGGANYDYVVSVNESLKTVIYSIDFKFKPDKSGFIYETDGTLCLPVPSTDLKYQSCTYKIKGATLIKSDISNDFELIYIKPTGTSEVTISCTITKTPYSYSSEIEKYKLQDEMPVEIQKYLESTDRFDLTAESIKSTAKTLKGSTNLETITNIMNWINTSKTYSAIPPTWTTVDDLIKSSTVECGTGSLTVVALARACGIPARQVWGPIDAGRDFSPENYLKGHVWFEFYLSGYGWIPAEQFDVSSIGFLPESYIRIMTSCTHLYDNVPLGNIMTIMNNATWGDIIAYKKNVISID